MTHKQLIDVEYMDPKPVEPEHAVLDEFPELPVEGWEEQSWFLATVAAQDFKSVEECTRDAILEVSGLGLACFAPIGMERRSNRPKKGKVLKPYLLFPPYLLVGHKVGGTSLGALYGSKSLYGMMCRDGIPCRMGYEMGKMVKLIKEGFWDESRNQFGTHHKPEIVKVGETYEIGSGAFQGHKVKIEDNSNPKRLKAKVFSFGGEIMTEIALDSLLKFSK